VIARLRPKFNAVPGLRTILTPVQDIRGGGHSGGAEYQFDLLDENLDELTAWTQKVENRLRHEPGFAEVSSDQDIGAPQVNVNIDRQAAARLQVSVAAIDDALANAFAQRQISTIYDERNQYKVVLETLPWLQTTRIISTTSTSPPIPACRCRSAASRAFPIYGTAPLTVTHEGQLPASTISFNLSGGKPAGRSAEKGQGQIVASMGPPPGLHTDFSGNAKWVMDSLSSEPALILAALLSIYIVLGVLYESLIHPLTIISSLPSAGVGALLAVLITGTDFGIMSVIGIVLLMGIVKKNAIMLVDFALEAQRDRGMTPDEAIREACIERFRPDHHDHAGRHLRRHAAGRRLRHRRRSAPPAGHRHRRRPDRQPGADAVYDAGGLSDAGTAGAVRQSINWASGSPIKASQACRADTLSTMWQPQRCFPKGACGCRKITNSIAGAWPGPSATRRLSG
jgi:multidrug efflux pump